MEEKNFNLEVFETLANSNVKEHSKDKGGLSYLPWAKAWDLFKRKCPDATYRIIKNENGLPYFADEMGIMVYTEMTVGGLTYEMWLSVMDEKNNAMTLSPQEIHTKKFNKQTRQWEDSVTYVKAATMNNINKAVMRCLTKNMAMFGLGLHLYEGEDVTIGDVEEAKAQELAINLMTLRGYINTADAQGLNSLFKSNMWAHKEEEFQYDMISRLKVLIKNAKTREALGAIYNASTWAQSNPEFQTWLGERQDEIGR